MKTIAVWILAESREGRIAPVTYELITRARQLVAGSGCGVGALLAGHGFTPEVPASITGRGVDLCVVSSDPRLAGQHPETHATALAALIRQFDVRVLLAGATAFGRTLLPYLAMKLETGLTADCTELAFDPDSGLLNQTRPAIGGNIMATIQCRTRRPQMATVRPHSTAAAPLLAGFAGEVRSVAPPPLSPSRLELVKFQPSGDSDDLAAAEKVVVIGRGVRTATELSAVRQFAALLDAAVGGTREVVDRGLLSYPHQIGLSGKTIAPKLYIGIGVSGAIQHLAGMRTAEKIIAINRDPEAAIFKVADVGIVGDWHAVLPALAAELAGKD